VLLRDPLDRCYSGLRHQIDRGRRPRSSHVAEAVERSLYGPQLRALLSAVEEQRVLIPQYEHCVRAAADELARAFAFLGLFDTDVPTLSRQVNGSARSGHAPVRAAYGAMLPPDRQLIDRMRADAREVAERFDLDPALWPTTEGPSE
jgi:hypothetical protein